MYIGFLNATLELRLQVYMDSSMQRYDTALINLNWMASKDHKGRFNQTKGPDRYIQVFHLRNRTVSASTTAVGVPGFGSMALDPEGHISERYWRRYTDTKESVGTTD